MTQFQKVYPELEATAPLMPGEEPQIQTPLHQMRRQQLHDVAMAWEIPVENGGTKQDILPMLLAAERNGKFKEPAVHPEYARKAMRNSDDPKPEQVKPGTMAPVDRGMPDYRSMDMSELTAACEGKGIDTTRPGRRLDDP